MCPYLINTTTYMGWHIHTTTFLKIITIYETKMTCEDDIVSLFAYTLIMICGNLLNCNVLTSVV